VLYQEKLRHPFGVNIFHRYSSASKAPANIIFERREIYCLEISAPLPRALPHFPLINFATVIELDGMEIANCVPSTMQSEIGVLERIAAFLTRETPQNYTVLLLDAFSHQTYHVFACVCVCVCASAVCCSQSA
jgi:hypothetical protein